MSKLIRLFLWSIYPNVAMFYASKEKIGTYGEELEQGAKKR